MSTFKWVKAIPTPISAKEAWKVRARHVQAIRRLTKCKVTTSYHGPQPQLKSSHTNKEDKERDTMHLIQYTCQVCLRCGEATPQGLKGLIRES